MNNSGAQDDTQIQEMAVELDCSICGESGLTYRIASVDIPYFGDSSETTISCHKCGHRDSEFMIHSEGRPSRFTLRVDGDRLNSRVVRGPEGSFIVPELDLEMSPRADAEAFVSNCEGILVRFQNAVETIIHSDPDQKDAAELIWNRLQSCREGVEPLTLVLSDPAGGSAILSPDAELQFLEPHQIADHSEEQTLTLEEDQV